MEKDAATNESLWEQVQQEVTTELEQNRKLLREVTLMLEQSQAELNKLTQRNAAITAHLQQVQSQFDNLSRSDIRMAYTAALDAQQRLLVMRGQLEKWQNDQNSLQRNVSLQEKILAAFEQGGKSGGKGKSSSGSAALKMVIDAQEAERKKLSTLMHDGPAQALSNFIVQTEIAARLLEIDPVRAKEELINLKNSAMSTFRDVRTFIFEIRPMMLDDLGLVPTVRRYSDSFKEQMGVDLTLTVKGTERRLQPYLEVMVFRAIQELLGNAARHNQDIPGRIQINCQIMIDEASIKVIVSDNGKGFDPETVGKVPGLGLKLIRERVEMAGGTFEIDSAVGKGSRIMFQVPSFEG